MRYVDPQIETLLSLDSRMACLMGELVWPSGVARFHNGMGSLTWDSQTYYGLGGNGSVGVIKEGHAPTVKLSLQTSDSALISEAIKDDAAGGDVRLYLGVFNEDQQLVARQQVYAGIINKTPVRYSSPPIISVEVNSYAHRWNQPKRYTTYSSASQRADYPDDSFFDDVEAVAKGPLNSYSGSNSVSNGGRKHQEPRKR